MKKILNLILLSTLLPLQIAWASSCLPCLRRQQGAAPAVAIPATSIMTVTATQLKDREVICTLVITVPTTITQVGFINSLAKHYKVEPREIIAVGPWDLRKDALLRDHYGCSEHTTISFMVAEKP